MNNNISPHIYVLTTFSAASASFFLFREYGHLDEWFFLPIFGVALVWGGANFIRQIKGKSKFYIDKKIDFVLLIKRVLVRYVVWMIVLYTGIIFFESHSFYSQYEKSLDFLTVFFDVYLIAGVPYFILTLIFKASRIEDYYDPAIRIFHIFKQIVLRFVFRKGRVFSVLKNSYNKKVLLNLIMRAYFIPAMVVQVFFNLDSAIRYSGDDFNDYNLMAILFCISSMLWCMDALNASAGYSIESRWAENRTRSIDMTVGGWLVCLACYAPINDVTGTLFQFGPSISHESFMFDGSTALLAFKIAEIILLSMLVYTDLSLGPSGVNITFKKIQTRGPYGIVRHPGVVCKLAFWWLQVVFLAKFWLTPQFIFGHLAWNVLYVMRALTEERHLKEHKEYREYMKKVKYRFIPGVF